MNTDEPVEVRLESAWLKRLEAMRPKFFARVVGGVDPSVVEADIAAIRRATTIEDAARAGMRALGTWQSMGVIRGGVVRMGVLQDVANAVGVSLHVDAIRRTRSLGFEMEGSRLSPEIYAALSNMSSGRYTLRATYHPSHGVNTFALSLLSNVSPMPWLARQWEAVVERKSETPALHVAEGLTTVAARIVGRSFFPIHRAWTVGVERRAMAARDISTVPDDILRLWGVHAKIFAACEVGTPHGGGGAEGMAVGARGEVAHPTVGAPFVKIEATAVQQVNIPPFTATAAVRGAGIAAIGGGLERVPVQDRLFLTFRHLRGVKSTGPSTADGGPCTRYGATGGNFLLAGSLSLGLPLPYVGGLAAAHAFVNGGILRRVEWSEITMDNASNLLRDGKATMGAGLVLNLPGLSSLGGRLEANVSFPITTTIPAGLYDKYRIGIVWNAF